MTLTELANKYGSDKGDKHFEAHGYTKVYEEWFAPLHDKIINILEIGVVDPSFPGASLQMWYEYFPSASIVGADIVPCPQFDNDRIKTVVMDQGSTGQIIAVAEAHGPFDIIIDDGSHNAHHQLRCFLNLYDYLTTRGQYWIEDCHVAPFTEMLLTMKHGTKTFCNDKLILIGA